jgi:hypothetical protein
VSKAGAYGAVSSACQHGCKALPMCASSSFAPDQLQHCMVMLLQFLQHQTNGFILSMAPSGKHHQSETSISFYK